MFELFFATKLASHIIFLFGFIGSFILYGLSFSNEITLILLILLLSLLLLVISTPILERIAYRKLPKIDSFLSNDCNADAYVAIYETFSKKRVSKGMQRAGPNRIVLPIALTQPKAHSIHSAS